jgi:hypothetical protein
MEPDATARELISAAKRYVQARLGLDDAAMRASRRTADGAWLALADKLAHQAPEGEAARRTRPSLGRRQVYAGQHFYRGIKGTL